jgi:GT2 family glycosyltransferase
VEGEAAVSVRIVIPSARASNLSACVRSIIAVDYGLPNPGYIIAVDDGARDGFKIPVTWVDGVKPFVFARNVNLGIVAAGDADVILMNDDAILTTELGFSLWYDAMQNRRDTVCSAAIVGTVCNPRQIAQSTHTFRPEPKHLAFVCVYLPRSVIDRVGLLDERFTAYGFEDLDYCRRALLAGCQLATWDGCVVDHAGTTSTFRTAPDWPARLEEGRRQFRAKWGDG